MIYLRSSEPHVWRQTFALLSLTVWAFLALCWLAIHGLGLIGRLDVQIFGLPQPVTQGWTWDDDRAPVLRVMQTTG